MSLCLKSHFSWRYFVLYHTVYNGGFNVFHVCNYEISTIFDSLGSWLFDLIGPGLLPTSIMTHIESICSVSLRLSLDHIPHFWILKVPPCGQVLSNTQAYAQAPLTLVKAGAPIGSLLQAMLSKLWLCAVLHCFVFAVENLLFDADEL